MKTKAVAPVVVLLAIVLLGGGAWGATKLGLFSKRTKEAETSKTTTEKLIAATDNQGASAAAYVATIGAANAGAPASKEKDAIAGLVPVALSYLPAPDPVKLLEAEKLKNAYLSGRLDLQASLTATALSDASTARQETVKAISAKRASDAALIESAHRENEANADKLLFGALAVLCLILWVWTKLTHVSPSALAVHAIDVRAGTVESPAIASLDSVTTPFQQQMVRANVWFKSKLGKLFS